jgi:hypothetical protein
MTGSKVAANGKATRMHEILREPLHAAQARMEALEGEARKASARSNTCCTGSRSRTGRSPR